MPSALARALLAAAVVLLVAAPAHASLIGEAADPAGDSASPDPGHDLLNVGLGYDRREGRVTAAFRLRGEPTTDAFVAIIAATRDAAGSCTGGAIGVATRTTERGGTWHRFANPAQALARGEVSKVGVHRAVQQVEVDDRGAAGVRPDCLIAELADPANAANVYDRVGPIALVAHPSLALELDGLPDTVRSGRSHRLRVTVSNPGDAPTANVRVRLPQVKGVRFARREVRLKPIAAGGKRSAHVRVRFSPTASTRTEVEARVTAGKLRVDGARRVFVRKPTSPKRRGGSGGGGAGTPSTCVRFIPDLSGESGGSLGLVPCTR